MRNSLIDPGTREEDDDDMTNTQTITCCARGDWDGYDHQPASAYIYVPHTYRFPFAKGEPKTTILPETTDDYRWECIYCGNVGTRAELLATS